MHTGLIGLNFKTAPIEVREKLHFSKDELLKSLKSLITYDHVEECIILATCNRVEIYAVSNNIEKLFEELIGFIAKTKSLEKDFFVNHLYKKSCEDAVAHLYTVASGIDSLVVGEDQIIGQVRDAYETAKSGLTIGPYLNKLFQGAVRAGKKVRSETEIAKGSVSVGSVAVDLVKEIFPENTSFKVLIIGAGEIAELTLTHLKAYGKAEIYIANRSKENAHSLAVKYNGSVVDFEDRYNQASVSDIIIASTGASNFIIKKDELSKKKIRPLNGAMFFIDLSVPRNVDPTVTDIDNIILYSIDDLSEIAGRNLEKRSAEKEQALDLIKEVSKDYNLWYSKNNLMPIIKDLENKYFSIKNKSLLAYSKKIKNLNIESQELVSDVMNDFIKKIIQEPLSNLEELNEKSNVNNLQEILSIVLGLNKKD